MMNKLLSGLITATLLCVSIFTPVFASDNIKYSSMLEIVNNDSVESNECSAGDVECGSWGLFDKKAMTVTGLCKGVSITEYKKLFENDQYIDNVVVLKNDEIQISGCIEDGMVIRFSDNNSQNFDYTVCNMYSEINNSNNSAQRVRASTRTVSNRMTSDYERMVFPLSNMNLENNIITSAYGERIHPISNNSSFHKGIDISWSGIYGEPIRAVYSGTATVANNPGGYGNYVYIDHGCVNGEYIKTLYGHMSMVAISGTQTVEQGQIIGYVGSTGASTGPHLHFEVRIGSGSFYNCNHTDPMPYLYNAVDGVSTLYYADGTFIKKTNSNDIYIMAGGAPLYVSSWDNVGGYEEPIILTEEQFARIRQYPADGTKVIAEDGSAYIFVGGSPLYISSWNNVGGSGGAVYVDNYALFPPNYNGEFSHVREYPINGTQVIAEDGSAYIFAGGSPLYISSWNNIVESDDICYVDSYALFPPHYSGRYCHISEYPEDGTQVITHDGDAYVFAGGAPMYISEWENVGGYDNATPIDGNALFPPNYNGRYSHVSEYPENGTQVMTQEGDVYVFAGGAPIYVTDWSAVGGMNNPVYIDDYGMLPQLGHALAYPVDDTYVYSIQNTIFRFEQGVATQIYSWNNISECQPATLVDMYTIYQGNTFDMAYYWDIDANINNTVCMNLISASKVDIVKIIAPVTGTYEFYTTNCTGDLFGELYDSTQIKLDQDDDNGGNYNYHISYSLISGQTYYLLTRNYSLSATNFGMYTLNISVQ